MPEFVRVKDKDTKHEYSVVASAVDPEHQDVVDKPATKCDGTPLAPKHYVAPESLSKRSSGQSAGPDKENSQ